jgi:hypothetical protein
MTTNAKPIDTNREVPEEAPQDVGVDRRAFLARFAAVSAAAAGGRTRRQLAHARTRGEGPEVHRSVSGFGEARGAQRLDGAHRSGGVLPDPDPPASAHRSGGCLPRSHRALRRDLQGLQHRHGRIGSRGGPGCGADVPARIAPWRAARDQGQLLHGGRPHDRELLHLRDVRPGLRRFDGREALRRGRNPARQDPDGSPRDDACDHARRHRDDGERLDAERPGHQSGRLVLRLGLRRRGETRLLLDGYTDGRIDHGSFQRPEPHRPQADDGSLLALRHHPALLHAGSSRPPGAGREGRRPDARDDGGPRRQRSANARAPQGAEADGPQRPRWGSRVAWRSAGRRGSA